MNDSATQLKIKRSLRNAWLAFFGAFGKLLPVQIQTIPLILDGQNVIVSSPTASGKTEAVMAPLAELVSQQSPKGLILVYISPTRALINDLHGRLLMPLNHMGITMTVKTSDNPRFDFKAPSAVLLTTPEGFDSLIARHEKILQNVKYVVLDELHLIDNNSRGDQLRILLNRLALISGEKIQFCALSATLGDASQVAARYFNNAVVVTVPGTREINYNLFPSLKEAVQSARNSKKYKILVFCNKRREVPEVAELVSKYWPANCTVIHHGQLPKQKRESAEEFMRTCEVGLCAATTTLEIGIDIGDIDLIILYGPPWSVSSLVQRIGRGNRRNKDSVEAYGIFRTSSEKPEFDYLFAKARNGDIELCDYQPSYEVITQQIKSCLYQRRTGLTSSFFFSVFQGFCTPDIVTSAIKGLLDDELIEAYGNKWLATTRLIDIGDAGFIHSNIRTYDYNVVDAETGNVIGDLSGVFTDKLIRHDNATWNVVNVQNDRIMIKRQSQ